MSTPSWKICAALNSFLTDADYFFCYVATPPHLKTAIFGCYFVCGSSVAFGCDRVHWFFMVTLILCSLRLGKHEFIFLWSEVLKYVVQGDICIIINLIPLVYLLFLFSVDGVEKNWMNELYTLIEELRESQLARCRQQLSLVSNDRASATRVMIIC